MLAFTLHSIEDHVACLCMVLGAGRRKWGEGKRERGRTPTPRYRIKAPCTYDTLPLSTRLHLHIPLYRYTYIDYVSFSYAFFFLSLSLALSLSLVIRIRTYVRALEPNDATVASVRASVNYHCVHRAVTVRVERCRLSPGCQSDFTSDKKLDLHRKAVRRGWGKHPVPFNHSRFLSPSPNPLYFSVHSTFLL